ncbi:MAG: amino acid adenylation domain-containing protein [Clostridia bacterium]|nr:amino acid adenylation domain-containing protein [Clostridia bacterium]
MSILTDNLTGIKNSALYMLEEAAEKFPKNIAAEDELVSVTFSGLRETARKVGTYLAKNSKSENIAILLPKRVSFIISELGTLYSGKAYVPVDYNDARDRLVEIIRGSDAECVITDGKNTSWLSDEGFSPIVFDKAAEAEIDEELLCNCLKDNTDLSPAYIMHTSGSTGVPKGVVVSHRGIIDFAQWIVDYMKLTPDDVIGLQSPFHFDASVFDLYGGLKSGCKITILSDALTHFPAKIPEFLEENGVTCILWVPGILADIAASGALEKYKLPKLRLFTFGGEVLPTRALNIWKKYNPDREYINLYGPTEATVVATAFKIETEISDFKPIPIGKAVNNGRILIITEDNRQAEINEVGEIYITGSMLACGYYKRPNETIDAFVQNPLNKSYNELVYKTGDFGYISENGDIVFSGRRDSQVKLYGIRVELGDIENAAMCVDGIEHCFAALDENGKVVLFLQSKEKHILRKFNLELMRYIPKYMLPHSIVDMKNFPLNKSGKIDRKKILNEWRNKNEH